MCLAFLPHAVSLFLGKLSLKRGSNALSLAIIVLVLHSLYTCRPRLSVMISEEPDVHASRDYENATERWNYSTCL